ncbi:MAG: hypothetical protein J0M21_08735, partial [Xanthomonadales bacterium]|nr:hypothetical protein [Xanthomonadales bacterium]
MSLGIRSPYTAHLLRWRDAALPLAVQACRPTSRGQPMSDIASTAGRPVKSRAAVAFAAGEP